MLGLKNRHWLTFISGWKSGTWLEKQVLMASSQVYFTRTAVYLSKKKEISGKVSNFRL
jgi:hypothetical protein